jgi:hypothetical protein
MGLRLSNPPQPVLGSVSFPKHSVRAHVLVPSTFMLDVTCHLDGIHSFTSKLPLRLGFRIGYGLGQAARPQMGGSKFSSFGIWILDHVLTNG